MPQAHIVYGKPLADGIYQMLNPWVDFLNIHTQRAPSLHVVLIGDNPSSLVYVKRKQEQCQLLGITSQVHHYAADSHVDDIRRLIMNLNTNDDVDGILVQMPLPAHLDSASILSLIDPQKDVDGLTPTNLGALFIGQRGLLPCTPLGVMHILKNICGDVVGKNIVVMGRSILVGKSLATMLTHANATVTLMHSHSLNARVITQHADCIVMAVGRPYSLVADDVRPGAVVIDVGINRTLDGSLVGDVSPCVASIAGAITPVPGGVGPMTIAALMANTVRIAYNRFTQLPKGKLFYDEVAVFKRTHPFPIGRDF